MLNCLLDTALYDKSMTVLIGGHGLCKTKRAMKTACKEQGKAIMDVYFVIRVVLKAVL